MSNSQIRQQIKGQRQKALIRLVDASGHILFQYSNQKNQLPRGCHTEQDLFAKLNETDLVHARQMVIASTQNPCIHRIDNETCCLDRILEICQTYPHIAITVLWSKPCWADVRFLANQGKHTQPYQDQLKTWIGLQMSKFGVTNFEIDKLEK
jgi:hypothetical protein